MCYLNESSVGCRAQLLKVMADAILSEMMDIEVQVLQWHHTTCSCLWQMTGK